MFNVEFCVAPQRRCQKRTATRSPGNTYVAQVDDSDQPKDRRSSVTSALAELSSPETKTE